MHTNYPNLSVEGEGEFVFTHMDDIKELTLKKTFIEEMIAHAQQEAPNECCGIIAGKDSKALKLYRATNEHKSPVKYSIPAQELFHIIKEIDSQGWELMGVYHSHTHTGAYPSATDVRLAFWPESAYFIVSLAPPKPLVRAFKIVDGKITEINIIIL